jgi:hypothetical protein
MNRPDLKIVETGTVHRRRAPFGMVFEALLHDLTISDGAIRLYAHMHWRYGSNHQMFERIGTMADAMGVTDKVIKTRTAELAAAGWIAVIARRTPEGKVTSNFYQVFESPVDAADYRKTYKRVDGEYLLPAPKPTPRKSRKGVGGAKYHKPKDKNTQVPADTVDTQVPTEGDTQVPTIQKQVIETQKIAASAAPSAKAGSYQALSGKTDAECEAERIAMEAEQRAIDEQRIAMNEQLDLLGRAVKHYLGISGTLATKYARMLYGVFKGGKKKSADDDKYLEQTALLKDAPVSANEFTDWAAEYCRAADVKPGAPTMIKSPEKLVSSILARRDRIAAKSTPAIVHIEPEPEYTPTDADREFMRANNPFAKGKAS